MLRSIVALMLTSASSVLAIEASEGEARFMFTDKTVVARYNLSQHRSLKVNPIDDPLISVDARKAIAQAERLFAANGLSKRVLFERIELGSLMKNGNRHWLWELKYRYESGVPEAATGAPGILCLWVSLDGVVMAKVILNDSTEEKR